MYVLFFYLATFTNIRGNDNDRWLGQKMCACLQENVREIVFFLFFIYFIFQNHDFQVFDLIISRAESSLISVR